VAMLFQWLLKARSEEVLWVRVCGQGWGRLDGTV